MWNTKLWILACEVLSVSFMWVEVASAEVRRVGSAAVEWDSTQKLGNKSSAVLCRCCVNVCARSVWASVTEGSGSYEDSLCLSRSTFGCLPFWLHAIFRIIKNKWILFIGAFDIIGSSNFLPDHIHWNVLHLLPPLSMGGNF